MLAALIGFLGDFDLAEEAAQEAFALAAERWSRAGAPDHPRAWLVAVARNRARDRIRRQHVLSAKTAQLQQQIRGALEMEDEPADEPDSIPDERLELLFACCHPALSVEAQVPLTLRALGGLTTEEIARAFLVAPETMKRRLTRAKTKIKLAGIPFSVPPHRLLPERLQAVLAVIYLIFNEGYGGREQLAAEALRLGSVLSALMPDEPEALGLLALMHLHHARRRARFHGADLVLLEDQDRDLWDEQEIASGRALLDRALSLRGRGPHVIQAAIASLQCEQPIDWLQVATLYGELVRLTSSPVVELNRAVAVAETHGPARGLEIVDRIQLPDYPYLHSTRGELLRRLGRTEAARLAYCRALELVASEAERRFLAARLDSL